MFLSRVNLTLGIVKTDKPTATAVVAGVKITLVIVKNNFVYLVRNSVILNAFLCQWLSH